MNSAPASHAAGRFWVAAALVLCFVLRLFYVFGYSDAAEPGRLGGDAADYFQIAWTLAQTGEYGRPVVDEATGRRIASGFAEPLPEDVEVEPDGWRPPGWTAVLALLLKLTGSFSGAYVGRFVIDVVALWALARLLPRFELGRWGARMVLLLVAVHPTWLIYSSSMLSEALTLALLTASLWTGFRLLEDPGSGRATLAGGSAAGLVLTHPFQLVTAVLLVAWWTKSVMQAEGREPSRTDAGAPPRRVLLVLTLAFVLPVAAWVLRNQIVLGHASLTTSSSNVLSMSWSEEFLAVYDNGSAEAKLPEGRVGQFFRSNWRQVPAVLARKLVGALGPFVESSRGGILEVGRAAWWLVGSMTFWAAILVPVLWRGRRIGFRIAAPQTAPLIVVYVGYLAMAMLTYPSIRFRAPLVAVEVLLLVSLLVGLGRRVVPASGQEEHPSTLPISGGSS